MKIKRVTRISDKVFKAILRLIPQLDPSSELPSRQDIESILLSTNNWFLIAELDNKVIAGILTLVHYSILTGAKFCIEDVVVDQSYRGKGIGRELLLYALEIAGSIGAKSVDLTSRPSRTSANKLYRELGFVMRETNVYRYFIKSDKRNKIDEE